MNDLKREQIKQTLLETKQRRKSQQIKIFELKVNCHHTSKEIFNKLNDMFIQAKWVTNDIIASNNIFHYNYLEHKQVKHFDKNNNEIISNITLPSVLHRSIIKQKQQDVITESKLKKKGKKVGKLKFKSQINCINISTGPWINIINSTKITIPGFKKLKVYGLKQFVNLPEYELANAKLIKKASGYYIHITVMISKNNKSKVSKNKSVGLDFGIKTHITTSDGDKINSSVQESDYLKFLQKQLHKKQKGSKRYWNLRNQIQKEYEHLINKKNNNAKQIVSKLVKANDVIYYQDDNIAGWSKFAFGKTIQHSILGRMKQELSKLEEIGKAFKVSRWYPSTKLCFDCGEIHNEMTLNDRIFKCSCGVEMDRDVHAALSILKAGSLKRTESLEQSSAELITSAKDLAILALDFVSVNDEAKKKVLGN
jgi:putative transposase